MRIATKKLLFTAILGLWGISRAAATEPVTTLTRSQKVVVWAQAKDAAVARGIESELQALLADRQIVSERYSKVLPPEIDPALRLPTLRQQSFNALIVLRPNKRIDQAMPNPAGKNPPESALESFLQSPPEHIETLPLNPASSLSAQSPVVAAPARGPIPGNQGPVTEQVSKVGAAVFDVPSGKLLWKGRFTVRASPDLAVDRVQKIIAESAVEALTKAQVLAPRP